MIEYLAAVFFIFWMVKITLKNKTKKSRFCAKNL